MEILRKQINFFHKQDQLCAFENHIPNIVLLSATLQQRFINTSINAKALINESRVDKVLVTKC